MKYPNGGVARFKTSGLREYNNTAIVRGSKASITVSKTNDNSTKIFFFFFIIMQNALNPTSQVLS